MKIVDAFIFYNELNLLDYRLHILDPVVDYFVIVESTHTFSGIEKKLTFLENKTRYEKYNHKIIHVIVKDFPFIFPNINYDNKDQWENETFQRNAINRGINQLILNDNDLILVSDVDEIPKPTILESIKNGVFKIPQVLSLELDFYYYNLKCKLEEKWYKSKLVMYKYYKQNSSPQNIRFLDTLCITNAGWHLSYFGDSNFIKNKIQNFSHQEFNNEEFTNLEKITDRIKNSKDLFNRELKIYNIPLDKNTNLPPLYDTLLKEYI